MWMEGIEEDAMSMTEWVENDGKAHEAGPTATEEAGEGEGKWGDAHEDAKSKENKRNKTEEGEGNDEVPTLDTWAATAGIAGGAGERDIDGGAFDLWME